MTLVSVACDAIHTDPAIPGDLGFGVEVTLQYDPADPYVVTLFIRDGAELVPWQFDRDLLKVGISEPAGIGDVVIFPCDRRHVVVRLTGLDPRRGWREGSSLTYLPAKEARRFVREMFRAVPAGAESVDVDGAIAALLAGEADHEDGRRGLHDPPADGPAHDGRHHAPDAGSAGPGTAHDGPGPVTPTQGGSDG